MTKKLGFGCMRLPLLDTKDPTSFDMPLLEKMTDTFIEKGFTYFDTAYPYHAFKSEDAVREALVKRHPRNAFQLADKMPVRMLNSKEDLDIIFQEQLQKCGVDFFDYYLLHNLGQNSYVQVKQYECFDFIRRKKIEGKVHYIGFSFHDTPELLDEILSTQPGLDFVQLQINYIDWENPNIQSRRCYETARKHNLPIIVMEPVKGGSLATLPSEAENLLRTCNAEASPASWAIRFAASLKGVCMVLSGMSSLDQVLDNTSYMTDFYPLCEEEISIIEETAAVINANIAVPCTVCRYCERVCPQNIAIPDYFSLYNNAKRTSVGSQFVYYLNIATQRGKAGDCIACRRCLGECPQHISIIAALEKVSAMFDNRSLPGRPVKE